ncbi:putative uncharacterized protein [Firmicutes bacterium CAG:83]|nr:putative uncharacterized protein [Firmicutes bacterium CAG:83]
MYRDMTRGSITRGLLFALPMAAGDPCGAGLCAGGAGGRQRHLGRYPYRLVSGGRRGIRLLLPPAQSAAPWGERRLIRGFKKSGASSMNCTPFVGQYGILPNKWGVFICQREYRRIKLKLNGLSPVQYRIQTVQAAYSCFCLTFGGHFRAGAALLLFYFFRASHYTSLRGTLRETLFFRFPVVLV